MADDIDKEQLALGFLKILTVFNLKERIQNEENAISDDSLNRGPGSRADSRYTLHLLYCAIPRNAEKLKVCHSVVGLYDLAVVPQRRYKIKQPTSITET